MSDDAQTERVSLTNFLIRDTAECIIGILALQVGDRAAKVLVQAPNRFTESSGNG